MAPLCSLFSVQCSSDVHFSSVFLHRVQDILIYSEIMMCQPFFAAVVLYNIFTRQTKLDSKSKHVCTFRLVQRKTLRSFRSASIYHIPP